ncbi:MAG: AIM24 family protein, partial [Deltaproteobacteria bacterium]
AEIIELPSESARRQEPPPKPSEPTLEDDFSFDVELDPEPPTPPPLPPPQAKPVPAPKAVALSSALPSPAAPGLGELLRESHFELPAGDESFALMPEGAAIRVTTELHARLSQSGWLRGPMQRSPNQKRFRGRATDIPFGEGDERLYALAGRGEIFAWRKDGLDFRIVELGEEAVYLLEDSLYAFEDGLGYENGRISSPGQPDLLLVHLRGRGKALLCVRGELRSLPIRPETPASFPLERLVGWTGGLTPNLLPEGQAPGRWLQLEGEGWALWSLPK